jgi:hypothetical protein
LTALGGVAVTTVLGQITGATVSQASIQFLPALFAAMIEGQRYGKLGAEAPGQAALWRAAIAMTGMATGLLLMWTWAVLTLSGEMVNGDTLFRIALMVFAYLVINRWIYQLGYRAGVRDQGG